MNQPWKNPFKSWRRRVVKSRRQGDCHRLNLIRRHVAFGLSVFALALVFLGAVIPAGSGAEPALRFIAIGDTPYSKDENDSLKGDITMAIGKADVAFVVHYGDFKGGGETCTEPQFEQHRNDIYNLLPGRVFFTPGDNDWTDCDRPFLNPPMSELASLDSVRRLFFEEPLELPADWAYARQPGFPENARWTRGGLVFVTVHLVGTNNGRMEILQDDVNMALALVDARDQANRVWLETAFQVAKKGKARALVVVTQADVTDPQGEGACTLLNRSVCDAFIAFRGQLISETNEFQSRKKPPRPVLLVHGDTFPYCLDEGFGGGKAPHLWRLNAWGDYKEPADATLITVQPEMSDKPFLVETLLGKEAPEDVCP